MKKASRYLAVLLSLLMLVTMTSVFVDAGTHETGKLGSEFYTVTPTATAQQFTKAPKMDGVLSAGEWGEKKFNINQNYLIGSKSTPAHGLVWVNVSDTGVENTPKPTTADAYMGWDKDHFYFALQVTGVKSTYNNEMTNETLWKGDCLQIQIADSTSSDRYEYGFAWSTGRRSQLSYRWTPTKGETGLTRQVDYMVKYDSGKQTTTYEVALPIAKFSKKTGFMKVNNKIPFSFALHVYDAKDPVAANDSNVSPGCFYEWARGVVGGDNEKLITSAAPITLGDSGIHQTTQKPPVASQPSVKNPTITTKAVKTTTATKKGAVKTTASTTFTTKPGSVAVPLDKAVATTDTKILALAQAKYVGQQLAVNEYDRVADKDFEIHKDQLLDMYYMDGNTLKNIPYSQDAKSGVRTYATKALPATVKKVYTVSVKAATTLPSDTSILDTATSSGTDTTATDAIAPTVTTTTKANTNGSSFPVVLVIVIAVVVIGGGAAAFFFLKKKK